MRVIYIDGLIIVAEFVVVRVGSLREQNGGQMRRFRFEFLLVYHKYNQKREEEQKDEQKNEHTGEQARIEE